MHGKSKGALEHTDSAIPCSRQHEHAPNDRVRALKGSTGSAGTSSSSSLPVSSSLSDSLLSFSLEVYGQYSASWILTGSNAPAHAVSTIMHVAWH